ncbi:hypothetical protein VNO77_08147 [Canavalia gladiata]|uniref:Uncharacterized protein n=1 Tax=Canavalia gladiata TaxID=3824 RepID=A0AAN9MC03_CANGL
MINLGAPAVATYLMVIHISWYIVVSAIMSGVIGARAYIGEAYSIEMVHKCFESIPGSFGWVHHAYRFQTIPICIFSRPLIWNTHVKIVSGSAGKPIDMHAGFDSRFAKVQGMHYDVAASSKLSMWCEAS